MTVLQSEIRPRVLIVYESLFGNTEQVARAIAEMLGPLADVTLADVSTAPLEPGDEVDLVIVGGPTHAFSMSSANTRADAVKQGGRPDALETGLREWIETLPSGHHSSRLATFDTRVTKVRHLPGSAAKGAARAARRHGFDPPASSESFYVDGVEGPLHDGELDRARAWAARLLASVRESAR